MNSDDVLSRAVPLLLAVSSKSQNDSLPSFMSEQQRLIVCCRPLDKMAFDLVSTNAAREGRFYLLW
jgi:hypothetical protein